MNPLPLIAGAASLVIVAGCANDGRDTIAITDPALSVQHDRSAASANAPSLVTVSGHYTALVDFSTLTLTPKGSNCLLEVGGQLVFSGTIAGTATGTTSALVFASCAEVASSAPGTFGDTFKSELVFEGTVNGEPARADLLYVGGVQPGGAITARLNFSRGVSGSLETDNAIVAVGGDYAGTVVITRNPEHHDQQVDAETTRRTRKRR